MTTIVTVFYGYLCSTGCRIKMRVQIFSLLLFKNSTAPSAIPLCILVYTLCPLEPILGRATSVVNFWGTNVECHNGLSRAVNKMQTTHSKGATDSVAHNEGTNNVDFDECDEWDEVFANQLTNQPPVPELLLETGQRWQAAHFLRCLVPTEDTVGHRAGDQDALCGRARETVTMQRFVLLLFFLLLFIKKIMRQNTGLFEG